MVAYCETVIREIREVSTEAQLRQVIDNSIALLKSKNSQLRATYFINMIVSLQAAKAQRPPAEAYANIKRAIEIFREYKKRNRELLF